MEGLHAVAKALIQEETLSADQILDVYERSRAVSTLQLPPLPLLLLPAYS